MVRALDSPYPPELVAVVKIVGSVDPKWDDMSEYVVHFAKQIGERTGYENCLSILAKRCIEARNPFGAAKNSKNSPNVVCLSEAPLHQLGRLADKRSKYGIGFTKEYVVGMGGGPILYAYKDTAHAKAVLKIASGAEGDPHHPIWALAPFIDLPGSYGTKKYFYEWEREWRVAGSIKFDVNQVAFLIMPEHLHEAARGFFNEAELENLGPNYVCPFIDPYWAKDKVLAALTQNAVK
jgi:hypothetical protein